MGKDALKSLVEYAANPGATFKVDRERSVVPGVKLIGNDSANGRHYPPTTLTKAKPLYEGKAVNVNHGDKPGAPRGYQDRIGSIRNVQERADGLYGDLHFNPKHALAEQLIWDAENNPANLGLSHNAQGRTVTRSGKVIVEEIKSVASVDLVADPATTRGLFEHQESKDMELQEQLDAAKTQVAELTTKNATLTEQVTALTTKVAAFEESAAKAAKAKAVADCLAAHKLKASDVPASLKSLIEGLEGDALTGAVKDLAETIAKNKPRSASWSDPSEKREDRQGSGVTDGKSFASAIRG